MRLRPTWLPALFALCAGAWQVSPARPQPIPARPELLRFAPFEVEFPGPERYRHAIGTDTIAYVVEDHRLPLVDLRVLLRIGAFLDPPGKDGLALMTLDLMRLGGTEGRSPAELEAALARLGAEVSTSTGDLYSAVRLRCLSSQLDAALPLLAEILDRPAFEPAALDRLKNQRIRGLGNRNDDAAGLADREWNWLLHGREHFSARYLVAPQLYALGRSDFEGFHRRYVRRAPRVLALSGDVSAEKWLPRLAGLAPPEPRSAEVARSWPPPAPHFQPRPGVYQLSGPAGQSQVIVGRLYGGGSPWDDPTLPASRLANQVLSGGSFASRLFRRLRTEEGLVYGVTSSLEAPELWPGAFEVRFQADPAKAGKALVEVLAELERLRQEPVSESELDLARGELKAEFAEAVGSARQIALALAEDQLLGRPPAARRRSWDQLQAVTPQTLRQAAGQLFDPAQLLILVVGDSPTLARELPPALQQAQPLPHRDPYTLEVVP
ncbi:MAG TPA: pitrilysin family protein [Thermoanaerobaculia bacterium]|nr:pitrilysin family protein [Thermoanaerobaculia bacterium]